MLDLGSTDFTLAVKHVDAPQLEILSNSLFDEWEEYCNESLKLPDYSLFLQVEEGSIIGQGKIKAAARALFFGVATYGGIITGVDIISQQVKATTTFLAEHAQSTFNCTKDQTTVRRRSGAPAYLQRLFTRVQNGEITPDEAFILAEKLLGEEASKQPSFLDALSNAFQDCVPPEQQPLQFLDLMEPPTEDNISDSRPPKPRNRRSPDHPPPLHYRVEVWRESKRQKKQTKVTTW